MMTQDYTPTIQELTMAQNLDGLMEDLMTGKLDAIGVCAVRTDGSPAFFYIDRADKKAVLRPVLNRLLGLYEANQQFRGLTNAPRQNRSYLVH